MPISTRPARSALRPRSAVGVALLLACVLGVAAACGDSKPIRRSGHGDRRASSSWRRPRTGRPCSAGTDGRARASRSRCPRATRPGSRPAVPDVLAAVLPNGTTATSDPVHLGEPLVWRPVKATDPTGKTPAGTRLLRDLGSRGRPVRDPRRRPARRRRGQRRAHRPERRDRRSRSRSIGPVVAAPPVWIDPDRAGGRDRRRGGAAGRDRRHDDQRGDRRPERRPAPRGLGRWQAHRDDGRPGRPGRGAGHGRLARGRWLAARVDRPADGLVDGDRVRPGRDRSAARRRLGRGGRHGQPRRPRRRLGLATRRATGHRRGARRGRRLAPRKGCGASGRAPAIRR